MLYAKHSWKAIMIEAGLDQPEARTGAHSYHLFVRDDRSAASRAFEIVSANRHTFFLISSTSISVMIRASALVQGNVARNVRIAPRRLGGTI